MQIRKLTDTFIHEYGRELKKAGKGLSPFDHFKKTASGLINPYESIDVSKQLNDMLQKFNFEDFNELNGFVTMYNDFHNGVIGLMQDVVEIENEKEYEKIVSDLFESLLGFENKKTINNKFALFIDDILHETITAYDIDLNKANGNEDFIQYLESIFKDENIAMQVVSLMHVATSLRDDKSFDREKLRIYFLLLVHFIAVLNLMRMAVLESIEKNKEFIPRSEFENIQTAMQDPKTTVKVGRNELCPCGSGKKYKKCCMNKQAPKQTDSPLDELDLPMAKYLPLSRTAIDGFYSLWSRFTNFANKELCKKSGKKYEKLYFKDEEDKYTLSKYAVDEGYYFEVRNFILTNFNSLIDEFIESIKLSKENISLLNEWKEYRLHSAYFFIYEKLLHGAIVWDMESKNYFYVYDLYSSVYDLSAKDKHLDMLLLPYKGRVIYDGVVGHGNINFGKSSMDGFLEEYCKIRKTKQICTVLPKQANTTKILQLRIDIVDAKPPIWRRVLVQENMLYSSFHYLIQDLFGWEDCHLYDFRTKNGIYTLPDHEDEFSENKDASKFVIGDDLRNIKDKIIYTYDFGDNWEHTIAVEDILEYNENEKYPKCIKGKNEGPFEDIGGIWAYNEIVQALKENDKEMLEEYYIDSDYDPARFSLKEINARIM